MDRILAECTLGTCPVSQQTICEHKFWKHQKFVFSNLVRHLLDLTKSILKVLENSSNGYYMNLV